MAKNTFIASLALAFCSVITCAVYSQDGHDHPQRRVHIDVHCWGDRDKGARVSIRWGHPDYHDQEYFRRWDIPASESEAKDFDLPDAASEFEIQTEGGHHTSYDIEITFDSRPGLSLRYHAPPHDETQFENLGGFNAVRSSRLNTYGEQNIRVFLDREPNPGDIPG